jgi:hypothetical protein
VQDFNLNQMQNEAVYFGKIDDPGCTQQLANLQSHCQTTVDIHNANTFLSIFAAQFPNCIGKNIS